MTKCYCQVRRRAVPGAHAPARPRRPDAGAAVRHLLRAGAAPLGQGHRHHLLHPHPPPRHRPRQHCCCHLGYLLAEPILALPKIYKNKNLLLINIMHLMK